MTDGTIGGGMVRLTAAPAAIRSAMQLSLDIDNPGKSFNPDTIDCASCHVATRARGHARNLGATLAGLEAFSSGLDLTLDLVAGVSDTPQQQRAFGYNREVAVWNQRTINESAAVAAYLSAMIAD